MKETFRIVSVNRIRSRKEITLAYGYLAIETTIFTRGSTDRAIHNARSNYEPE